MIQLRNVVKTFDTKQGVVEAVKDVNLHVKKGEIHGVIGYSGAGKSTLIRCVNLLERPTSGEVIINGIELTSLKLPQLREVRQNIGMIFQSFNLLKTATVFENITIPLRLLNVSNEEANERAERYLEIVGLSERKNAYPSQLSGGQKQRVAIARALSQEPEVLLSDESTSALDPETTDSILDLLLKINKELGITILLITHEMNVIQKICDHVYVMERGQVIEEGTTIELFTKPKNPTTQKFLNAVSQRQLAPALIEQLTLDGYILRLTFVGDATGDPLIASLTEKFHVKPNILSANIIELKNGIVGNLVIHLEGQRDETIVQYLTANGVYVEEVL